MDCMKTGDGLDLAHRLQFSALAPVPASCWVESSVSAVCWAGCKVSTVGYSETMRAESLPWGSIQLNWKGHMLPGKCQRLPYTFERECDFSSQRGF